MMLSKSPVKLRPTVEPEVPKRKPEVPRFPHKKSVENKAPQKPGKNVKN